MRLKMMLATATSVVMLAGGASAATFTSAGAFAGNTCQANDANFGGGPGFGSCTYGGSDVMGKINVGGNFETGGFASIDGSEFTLAFNTSNSGTWSYEPGVGDPNIITAFVLKQDTEYEIFTWDGLSSGTDFTNVSWSSANTGNGNGLSNITWFDTTSSAVIPPIPLPGVVWLMLSALGTFAAVKRFKSA